MMKTVGVYPATTCCRENPGSPGASSPTADAAAPSNGRTQQQRGRRQVAAEGERRSTYDEHGRGVPGYHMLQGESSKNMRSTEAKNTAQQEYERTRRYLLINYAFLTFYIGPNNGHQR